MYGSKRGKRVCCFVIIHWVREESCGELSFVKRRRRFALFATISKGVFGQSQTNHVNRGQMKVKMKSNLKAIISRKKEREREMSKEAESSRTFVVMATNATVQM
jgi:hypothetical protein